MRLKNLVFTAIYILITCIFGINSESQELQHETGAINIEVPVRIFKGDTFVDDLTIDDFEIYEDGVLQKIEAVYLIQQKDITRKEEVIKEKHKPEINRTFIIYFQIRDNLPEINELDALIESFRGRSDVKSVERVCVVLKPIKAPENPVYR